MKLPSTVGSTALVLAGMLASGYALGQTAQEKVDVREALRRAAVVEHQKRNQDFALRCVKRDLSGTRLEACRLAYRKLYSPANPPAF